jgi:hypothetical protein
MWVDRVNVRPWYRGIMLWNTGPKGCIGSLSRCVGRFTAGIGRVRRSRSDIVNSGSHTSSEYFLSPALLIDININNFVGLSIGIEVDAGDSDRALVAEVADGIEGDVVVLNGDNGRTFKYLFHSSTTKQRRNLLSSGCVDNTVLGV